MAKENNIKIKEELPTTIVLLVVTVTSSTEKLFYNL